MKVICERCGNSWDYHGKSKWNIDYPKCNDVININQLIEKD